MKLTFWGVRGSIPTPYSSHMGIGGNTPCVGITTDSGAEVIVDAGTGICGLGRALQESGAARRGPLKLFLTHFHWDHIQGLPFFAPLYDPEVELLIHTPASSETARRLMANLMCPPHFSIGWEETPARKTFVQVESSPVQYDGFCVAAFPLNHPQGASGYRLHVGRTVVVYASDTEHGDEESDRLLRWHSRNADLLIYDAQYTPQDYERRRGWGHSTWEAGVQLASAAGVGKLVLFHHDPNHDDRDMEAIVAEARSRFPQTVAAREGWRVEG